MKYHICTVLIAAVAVAASYRLARAEPLPAGEVLELDASGGFYDDSGIIIWNRTTDVNGDVTIQLDANEPGEVEEGFELLDGTLRVTVSGLQPGEYQVLIMREYAPDRVRAIPRKKAIRVMRHREKRRREKAIMIWTPAKRTGDRANSAPRVAAAPKRQARQKDSSILGAQGYDPGGCYAWTVVDQASDFAVGVQIPEPSTMALLFGAGGSLLGMHLLRRRP